MQVVLTSKFTHPDRIGACYIGYSDDQCHLIGTNRDGSLHMIDSADTVAMLRRFYYIPALRSAYVERLSTTVEM